MTHTIIEAGGGPDYDWSNDHIYVKTPADVSGGQITVVEDTLKPGFHLARHYHKRMTEVFYILEGEVVIEFDKETITATPGTTVNVPPSVMHEITCSKGAKLITVFSPGGFDRYLEELASFSGEQFADSAFMQSLAEKYDTWMAETRSAT